MLVLAERQVPTATQGMKELSATTVLDGLAISFMHDLEFMRAALVVPKLK